MPKEKKLRGDRVVRGGPLADQIHEGVTVKSKGRQKDRKRRREADEYVESDLTKKILSEAQKQQHELDEEFPPLGAERSSAESNLGEGAWKSFLQSLSSSTSALRGVDKSEDEEEDDEESDVDVEEDGLGGEAGSSKALEPEVAQAFGDFFESGKDGEQEESSHSILLEARTEVETVMSDPDTHNLNPELVAFVKKHAEVLRKYRSGTFLKFVKRLPMMDCWEECLNLMEPQHWSAASVYAITRIFTSNLKNPGAQRFFTRFLLPRVRDEILEYKKLTPHTMEALRKAMFKQGAFFKGIVLPLCEAGDCTLKEATIVSSVLREKHIPANHANAAIYCLSKMEYSGANAIFLRALLDKKHALALKAVDACVAFFERFLEEEEQRTVLWHQCLLTFVQRHKCDLTAAQKDTLRKLVKKHHHHEMTPEILREMDSSPCRGEATDVVMKE